MRRCSRAVKIVGVPDHAISVERPDGHSDRDFGQIRWLRIRSIEPLADGGGRLDGEAEPAGLAL